MNEILLIDDEPEQLELVASCIEDEIPELKIIRATSIEEAIDILEDENKIIGIFSDLIVSHRSGREIFKINKEKWQKPMIFLTNHNLDDLEIDPASEINDYKISKPFSEKVLISAIKNIFLDPDEVKLNFYKKVRASLLCKYLKLKANVYIRLSDRKYIKIISDKEELDSSIFDKYELKGQEFLYLESSVYEEFMKQTQADLNSQFRNSFKEETLNISSDVLEYVHEGVRNLGVHEEQVLLISKCVEKCVLELKKDPTLEDFLDNYLGNEDYLVYHSILALHISYMMAVKINYFDDWILEKLAYAALLHDIVLPDSNLSMVLNRNGTIFKSLTNKEKTIVIQHPSRSARLVESIEFLPRDISNLINEHHERPDGSGFPRGLKAHQIKALSCLFIIALQGADYFFHNGFERQQVDAFIIHLNEKFDEGNFKAAKDALVELLETT